MCCCRWPSRHGGRGVYGAQDWELAPHSAPRGPRVHVRTRPEDPATHRATPAMLGRGGVAWQANVVIRIVGGSYAYEYGWIAGWVNVCMMHRVGVRAGWTRWEGWYEADASRVEQIGVRVGVGWGVGVSRFHVEAGALELKA